ncbi:hypothetical protein [uncultured Draconibacterium sp.]|uniref:hypothetical protein n=1 Tax=uncultured Draconibacterium sp. TaxID=1573823 RepID=UPI003216353E
MRTVDKVGKAGWERGRQTFEAYPGNSQSRREVIEQHYIVPWEMTEVEKKKTEDIKSSGQVAYF